MTQQKQFDYLFKIVIVGDSGVGKTNLLSKYAHNSFQESTRATIGVELLMHKFEIEGKLIQSQIWDTAGQERFRAIAATYYRNTVGAIVVFDLTKTQSFLHLTDWLTQIRSYSQPDISILVIGNKSDLTSTREVKQELIQDFIHKNNLYYIQTSARDGTNVQKAFTTLIEQVYQRQKTNENGKRKSDKKLVSNSVIIDKNNNKTEQKKIKIKEKKDVVKTNCC